MGTVHETQCTFFIISRSVLLGMRNVLEERFREIPNTRLIFSNFFNRAVYEIMWENISEPGWPQMTVRLILIACWTPKATYTHSEYVILFAFPLQHWLHERTSILRFTHIAFLAICLYENCMICENG